MGNPYYYISAFTLLMLSCFIIILTYTIQEYLKLKNNNCITMSKLKMVFKALKIAIIKDIFGD